MTTADDAREYAAEGQRILRGLAESPLVTIAFLSGPVHGPGLELALACDYRLAVATPTTTLGFPHLRHSVPPAWGGLTRLTRLIGASATVEMLCREPRTAREAARIGLVDRAFCERRAMIELATFLDQLRRRPRKPSRWHTPLDGWAARRVVAAYRHSISDAVAPIIPAAAASEAEGLLRERQSFIEAIASEAGRNARTLWTDECRLRAGPAFDLPRIAVVGPLDPVAGLIHESLLRGSEIGLFDDEHAGDSRMLLDANLAAAIARGRLTPLEADGLRRRIRITRDEDFDLVLVMLDGAQALEIAESLARPAAAIALVNHELRPLRKLCSRPRNLVGLSLHSPLAEINTSDTTLSTVTTRLKSWLASLDLTPLVPGGKAGSLVKPLQVAYWDEAVRLVADGLPIALVDAAARSLGASRGPLETLDGVGLAAVADRVPRVKPLLDAGIRGRPHDEGFYVLSPDNPTQANAVAQLVLLEAAAEAGPRGREPVSEASALTICEERLSMRVLVTAAKLLARNSAVEVDLAVVRGLGLFAASAGILHHYDRLGLGVAVERLRTLRRLGDRFAPPQSLLRRLAEGDAFHGGLSEPQPLRLSA